MSMNINRMVMRRRWGEPLRGIFCVCYNYFVVSGQWSVVSGQRRIRMEPDNFRKLNADGFPILMTYRPVL